MPDIGLLQGSRPRVVPPPAMPDAEISAAPFFAHVAGATAVISAPLATVVSVAAPAPGEKVSPARADAAGIAATPPKISAGAAPPIRLSDLFWLALALCVIVGTGLG